MKEITLKILAKDIMQSSYANNNDCAIKRAMKRTQLDIDFSGIPTIIELNGNRVYIGELDAKVRKMYAFESKRTGRVCDPFKTYNVEELLEPIDFEYKITI